MDLKKLLTSAVTKAAVHFAPEAVAGCVLNQDRFGNIYACNGIFQFSLGDQLRFPDGAAPDKVYTVADLHHHPHNGEDGYTLKCGTKSEFFPKWVLETSRRVLRVYDADPGVDSAQTFDRSIDA